MMMVLTILALVIVMGIVMVMVARKREKDGMPVEKSYRRLYIFGIIVVFFSIVGVSAKSS